jgi:hypothetical protein
MGRRSRTMPRYSPIVFSLLIVACGSTPRVFEPRLSQEYFSSRSEQLRYRLPIDWLNATNDAPSANSLIWLVRHDFTATLAVREVVIDAETRQEVNREGLKRVAELTLALTSGERGVNVVKQPSLSSLQGTNVCTYEYLAGHPTDRIYIVLVDTGKRVYEVSALMTSDVSEETATEVISLQKAFVQNVLW